MIRILKMTRAHKAAVLAMMRVFYASPAVHTNGSEKIFESDFLACVGENPYAEGYLFEETEPLEKTEPPTGNSVGDSIGDSIGGAVGKPVGYAMLAKSFSTEYGCPCIWIEDLYLLPEARGKGTAGRFFRFLEESYPNAIFRLEVEKENQTAVHTYRKNGFSPMPYLEMKK